MTHAGASGRLSWAVAGLLSAGCAAVPCLFITRLGDPFVVPKLAGLWVLLIVGLVLVALSPLVREPSGAPLRWNPVVDGAGIALLVLNGLATAFSSDRHQSLFGERLQYQGLLTVLLYGGLFLLARHAVVDARRLTLVFGGITAGAAVVAGYAILQKLGVDPIWKGFLPEGRVFSTFGQPNALGAYLVIALAPACHLAWVRRGAARALALLVAAGILAALVLTLSRGGFVGLVVMAVVAIGLLQGRRWLGVGAVLVATAGALLVPQVRSALASRRGGQGEQSIENHLDQWRVAARIAVDHPLLGTGPETFPDVFPRVSHAVLAPERAAYFDAFRVESAHNVFLTMAASSGPPTLLAYAVLVGGVLVLAVRAAGSTSDEELRLGLLVLVAAVAGHLASDAFMSAEVTSTGLLWTLLGAAVGMVTSTRTPEGQSKPDQDSRLTASGRFDERGEGPVRAREGRGGTPHG